MRLLKIVGIIIGGIFLLLFLAPFLLKGTVKSKLDENLPLFLDAEVSYQDVSFSLLKNFPNLYLKGEDILIKGKGSFTGDTLLACQQLELVWNFWPFNKGTTHLKDLQMDQAYLHVIYNEEGGGQL